MANKGLSKLMYAPLSTTGSTYSAGPAKLAGAINVKADITYADGKLYADDVLQEEDKTFVSGKLTMTVDDDDLTIFAPLLGQTTDPTDGVVSSIDDTPVAIGVGYIVKKSGTNPYRVKFYPKVVLSDFDTEAKTKEDKIEYVTPSVEATIYTIDRTVDSATKTVYRIVKDFATKAAAVEALEALFTQATP